MILLCFIKCIKLRKFTYNEDYFLDHVIVVVVVVDIVVVPILVQFLVQVLGSNFIW